MLVNKQISIKCKKTEYTKEKLLMKSIVEKDLLIEYELSVSEIIQLENIFIPPNIQTCE